MTVLANLEWLALLQTANLSVFSTMTVLLSWPVKIKSVWILVRVCAASMLHAGLGTTSQYVSATGITREIPSPAAVASQVRYLEGFQYQIFSISATQPIEVIQPCNPSPCGINAECLERNNAASCRCIAEYIGNPYIECKPECVVSAECPRDKACVSQKCRDPCPGVCGAHAYCTATNHNAICQCDPGYTGNAFVACQRITTCKCKQ